MIKILYRIIIFQQSPDDGGIHYDVPFSILAWIAAIGSIVGIISFATHGKVAVTDSYLSMVIGTILAAVGFVGLLWVAIMEEGPQREQPY